ncbi:MAG TPA: hypothetical protein VGL19_17985, partial [Polyangiaceae bacterium]
MRARKHEHHRVLSSANLPGMSRWLGAAHALLAVALAITIVAGCGGKTVVRIDGAANTVSASALDHWMRALVGSDFR